MYHSAVATSSPSYLVSPEIFWKNSLYILMGPPSDGCCRYQIDLMLLFCWSGTMITSVLASKIHVKYQKMKQMILLHSVWKVIDFSFIILLCPSNFESSIRINGLMLFESKSSDDLWFLLMIVLSKLKKYFSTFNVDFLRLALSNIGSNPSLCRCFLQFFM